LATVARREITEVVVFRDTGVAFRAGVGFTRFAHNTRAKRAVDLFVQRGGAALLARGAGGHARAEAAAVHFVETRSAFHGVGWAGGHACAQGTVVLRAKRSSTPQMAVGAGDVARAHCAAHRHGESLGTQHLPILTT